MQILNYVLTVLSFVMVIVMLITFRKVRTISLKSPLIAISISVAVFAIFCLFIGTDLPALVIAVILAAGFVLGGWQGKKTNVWMDEDGRRKAQNTIWYLVIWALCYGVTQTLVSLGQTASLNVGIGTMGLGTGVSIGAQSVILIKLMRAPAIGAKVSCPACGSPVPEDVRFCTKCGADLPTLVNKNIQPIKSNEIEQSVCPGCGKGNSPYTKFCTNCGYKLK